MEQGELGYLRGLPAVRPARRWEIGGGVLGWDEWGDPAGQVVVFYHGWPSSRLQGRMLHWLALERGMRVIAVDRPGMGESTRVAGRRLGWLAPVLAGLLDHLGVGRIAQLGLSGGGPYVLAGQDFFGARVVASAVLCGAVPLRGAVTRGLHPVYRLLLPLRRLPAVVFEPLVALGGRAGRGPLGGWLMRRLLATLPPADRAVLASNPLAVPEFLASFQEGVRQGARGVLGDAEIYLDDWTLDWDAPRAPLRYWHGTADGNIPVDLVRAMVARLPGAELVEVPGDGHFSLALRYAPAALDFLGGWAASGG